MTIEDLIQRLTEDGCFKENEIPVDMLNCHIDAEGHLVKGKIPPVKEGEDDC